MNKIKAIISGSDGTLVDSLYMIRRGQYEAVIEYMVERGIGRQGLPTYEEYGKIVNQSVGGRTRETMEKSLRILFAKNHKEQLEEVNFDDLERRLEPIQDRLALLYLHQFYDLQAFLHWMSQQKLHLGLFTSGTRHQFIRNWGSALPALGYSRLYQQASISEEEKIVAIVGRIKATFGIQKMSVVTSDDVATTKPDPEGLLKALKELGVQPTEAIMVGDLAADISAGKDAGVLTVGISHGFGTVEELKKAGADEVVGNLAELQSFIASLRG